MNNPKATYYSKEYCIKKRKRHRGDWSYKPSPEQKRINWENGW